MDNPSSYPAVETLALASLDHESFAARTFFCVYSSELYVLILFRTVAALL